MTSKVSLKILGLALLCGKLALAGAIHNQVDRCFNDNSDFQKAMQCSQKAIARGLDAVGSSVVVDLRSGNYTSDGYRVFISVSGGMISISGDQSTSGSYECGSATTCADPSTKQTIRVTSATSFTIVYSNGFVRHWSYVG